MALAKPVPNSSSSGRSWAKSIAAGWAGSAWARVGLGRGREFGGDAIQGCGERRDQAGAVCLGVVGKFQRLGRFARHGERAGQRTVELEALGGDRRGAVGERAAHQIGKALARKVRLDLDRGIDLLPGFIELLGVFGDVEHANSALRVPSCR
jgi:hypothetical protein